MEQLKMAIEPPYVPWHLQAPQSIPVFPRPQPKLPDYKPAPITRKVPNRNEDDVRVPYQSYEFARITRDGTVAHFDIEFARDHAKRVGAKWGPGRVVEIADVIAVLVADAYEMGRLDA